MTSESFTQPDAPHVADQIDAYLAGGLTAAERAAFEAHVAGCDGCGELLEQMRRADSALADLFASARPADQFEDRLVARLRKVRQPRWRMRIGDGRVSRLLLHPTVRRAAIGVAATVVLAAVGHAAKSALDRQTLPGMRHGKQWAELSTDLKGAFSAQGSRRPPRYLRDGAPNPAYVVDGDAVDNSGASRVLKSPTGDGTVPLPGEPVSRELSERKSERLSRGTGLGWAFNNTADEDVVAGRLVTRASERGWGEWASADAYLGNRVPSRDHRLDTISTTKSDPSNNYELEGVDHFYRTASPAAVAATTPPPPASPPVTAGASAAPVVALSTASTSVAAGTLNVTNGPVAVPTSGSGTPALTGMNTFAGGVATNGGTVLTTDGIVTTPPNAYSFGMNTKDSPAASTVVYGRGDSNGTAPAGGPGAVAELGRASGGMGGGGGAGTGGGGGAGRPGAGFGIPAAPAGGAVAAPINIEHSLAAGGFQEGFKPTELAYKDGEAERSKLVKDKESVALDDKDKKSLGDRLTESEGKSESADSDLFIKAGDVKGKVLAGLQPQVSTPAILAEATPQAGKPALEAPPAAPAGEALAKVTDQAPQPATPEPLAQHAPEPALPATPPATPAPTPPPAPPATPQPAPAPHAPSAAELQPIQRKIIRNGEMIFDVDSFDSAMLQIGKIAAEEGGFVATTDSEKLPNGKVKGSVIVRCPPERLDTLVLKLRGLGDLKSQRIAAQDITKQYTDLESQLRAARAMEDRLLLVIKDGKGAIKDLLEAEKQLGVWREKIEGLEGEIRYYNNLVSLSTLTVTLMERDIKTPYATAETEHVSMGVEAEDVEKARADAIAQIEQVKGRIIESDLKKHEAAQFSATITADVAPDAADPLIDRLKQIGRVARLERERKTTSEGGTGTPPPGVKLERKDTRLQLSIYNLADISPRTTTSMSLAADDVEKTYKSIVDQVKTGGGRIVSSQLNRPKADQVTGTITFDVQSEKADVLSAAIRTGVEVMRLDVNENKDTQDLTDAKRGFVLQIFSLSSVAPRETTTLQIASKDVPAAFNKLLEAARTSGGRVSTSQLNEQNVASITGTLDFDVPRTNSAKIDAALHEAGLTVTRNVSRSPDSDSTVDSKVRLQVTLIDEINLAARQSIGQTLAARNVPEAFNKLTDALHDAGARVITSQLADQDKPTVNGQINFSIERADSAKVDAALREAGETVVRSVARSADLQNTVDTKLSYQVTIVDQRNLQPRETVSELVAVRDVPGRYEKVLETLRLLDAQVYQSQLNEQNKNDVSAVLDFAVRRDSPTARDQATVEKALGESSDIFGRTIIRSQDVTNTVDSKVHYSVTMRDADTQPPRETYTMDAEVSDVDKALSDLEAATIAAGGRAVDSTPVTTRNERGEPTGRIVLDVPLKAAGEIVNAVRDRGHVTATRRSRDDRVPEGDLSRARIEVTVGTGAIMAGEGGLWDTIRSGLRTSGTGLLYALQFVIIGLCLIGPFVLVLWAAVKLFRWSRRKQATSTTPSSPPPAEPPGPVPAPG